MSEDVSGSVNEEVECEVTLWCAVLCGVKGTQCKELCGVDAWSAFGDAKIGRGELPNSGAAGVVLEGVLAVFATKKAGLIVVLEAVGGAPAVGEGAKSSSAAVGWGEAGHSGKEGNKPVDSCRDVYFKLETREEKIAGALEKV